MTPWNTRLSILARGLPALLMLALALPALSLPPDEPRHAAGTLPSELAESRSLGPVAADLPLERIVLVLAPSDPEGLSRLLAEQQDPSSPLYHRWITPAEFGQRFGARAEDVAALSAWLTQQGLAVEDVPSGRLAVLVTGRAMDVEKAFATRIEELAWRGEPHRAAVVPPSVPARFAHSLKGVLSLHDFHRKAPLVRPAPEASPLYNAGLGHRLGPADFRTIYGADALGSSGVDGTGASIAIVGRTNVNLADTRSFRQFFGLAPKDPQVVLNGVDPGLGEFVEVLEANLDIQWSGSVAPNADVKLVVTKSTAATDGIDLSALYAVDHDVADVVSVSFGICETDPDFTAENLAFYANLWAQAAAQGTSVIVASGDSGAAGCDDPAASKGTVLGVNGLSTPPYATCVGGTGFLDGTGSYWSSTNDATTQRSALGYIPETVWNDSGSNLYATGGGLSAKFARPSWQGVAGLAGGSMRAVPDISVAAAGHTPYVVTVTTNQGVLGTSASAPAFAGLAALLKHKAGGRLGSLNPALYALGAAQYAGSGPAVFHDVTQGNNSVPGLAGFAAGPGFDLSTGLGTPNTSALGAAWPAPQAVAAAGDTSVGASPGVLSIAPGASATSTLVLDSRSPSAATVTASAPAGLTVTFAPGHESTGHDSGYLSAGTSASATVTAAGDLAPGSYDVDLAVTLAGVTRHLRLVVAVGGATPSFGDSVELQVPVVLDVFGAESSHYTSDLVAVNRSSSDATVELRYSAQPGTPGAGGPVVARSLGAGRALFVSDVIAFLRASGWTFPDDGSSKIGTLYVTFAGASDGSRVFAGSRTTTPNHDSSVGGAYGTFAAATRAGTASASEAWVYGLRETGTARSNLAVVHSPAGPSSLGSAGPMGVEVQVFDGASGQAAGAPIAITLQPGELHQINGVLTVARAGLANGYARVRRTSGSDRFIAYGVVNDGGASQAGTSDGSFIVSGGGDGLVPIVLDLPGAPHYRTELALTNTSGAPSSVTLTYTPSTAFSASSGGGTVTAALGAGAQLITDDAIAYLRSLGLAIPADGSKQGGTLLVSGAVAQARTYSPNPNAAAGGTYGLSYPAVAAGARAHASAIVYGLRQDDSVRSNLAIADARIGDSSVVDYAIDVYDAVSGASTPVKTIMRSLAGGQWTQVDSILFDAGVARGWVRVHTSSGASNFVTYGVVNDGPTIGSRTSDGSYLPMVVEE